jgi:hypothetical protein
MMTVERWYDMVERYDTLWKFANAATAWSFIVFLDTLLKVGISF